MVSGTMTGLSELRYRQWRLALTVILTLLTGGLLVVLTYRTAAHFGDLFSLYFEAWVLQFLLAPTVDWLCKHRWPRGLAAGVVYLGTLVLGTAILIVLVPVFVSPLQDLAGQFLGSLGTLDIPSLEAQAHHAIQAHAPRSLQGPLDTAVQQGAAQLQGLSKNVGKDLLSLGRSLTTSTISQTFNLVGSALGVLLSLVTVLILSFFMMTLGRPFLQKMRSYLPRTLDPDLDAVQDVINRAFGGFVRGQLILSTIYSVAIIAILLALSLVPGSGGQLVRFAALAGILGGVIMIIPAIGAMLAMIPPMLVGAIALPDWPHRIALMVIIWALNVVVTDVLGPRVMSEAVGINPILSFGALIVGAQLGGILGAFFAAPILAVSLAVLDRIYLHLTQRTDLAVVAAHGPAERQHAPDGLVAAGSAET
jgi:predicted PurR-regulated permease PerM